MDNNEIVMEMVYMKAKDVMNRYNITRNTLSNWVKKGKIQYEITPTGRYVYIVQIPQKNINV